MRRARTALHVLLTLSVAGGLALAAPPAGAFTGSRSPVATGSRPGGFPGSNGLIAWSRLFLFQDSEIWVMNPDGTDRHQLSHDTVNNFNPAWSADGTRMAFDAAGPGGEDIYVMNADGSGEVDITDHPGPDIGPAWSPDGTRIAYWRQTKSLSEHIFVVAANGSHRTQLTFGPEVDNQPAWSPDGSTIAFSSNRDGNVELYLMNPDGSNVRRLTNTPGAHEQNPSWSPDGARIAYDSCVSPSFPCPGTPNNEIFTLRLDTGHVSRLTFVSGIDQNPAWSPDGTQIVFRSDRASNGTQIWKMNADGSDQTQLTFKAYSGGVDPDWQAVP
jgi:Tol biopolymer transport system component